MKLDFGRINIFTVLLVAASFGFTLRLVDIAQFDAGQVKTAQAVEEKSPEKAIAPTESAAGEEPPPLTQEQVSKSIAETQKVIDDGKAASGAAPKIDLPAAPGTPASPAAYTRAFSETELDVLQSLSKRREDLEKRERALMEREALLQAAGVEVDRKVTELNKLKTEIETLLGQQESMADERINSLVKIYEAMKPKEAATIFNTLDLDVLLSVVGRMNERKVSPILASMDPEKARIVTIRLAEQRQLPQKDTDTKEKPAETP